MWRKQSNIEKDTLKKILQLNTTALIETDFTYNHNGSKIAIADSEGNVYIYQRHSDSFQKINQFKADDAAIWKLSWSDPIFGQLIAIASFKKKVGVFQNKNNKWIEIARHQTHEGSVNHVQWAPAAYGIKLYSAGSDGTVCILQVRKNNWQLTTFKAHQSSINCLTIKNIPLNEQNRGLEHLYPTIATISKDLHLKVWRHVSEAQYLNLSNLNEYPEHSYHEVANFKPHKQFTRIILFQQIWSEVQNCLNYNIISGSEDGTVKISILKNDKAEYETNVHKGESPVVRLNQSITGKHLSVSVASHSQQNTFVYTKRNNGQWDFNQIQ